MKRKFIDNNFGQQLANLRKAKGLTQQQLADTLNVSRRVIAYYEAETNNPPANLIIPLSKALNVTTDELLGVRETKNILDGQFAALWRRLKVLETFPDKDRRAVLQLVDLLAEKNKNHQDSSLKEKTM